MSLLLAGILVAMPGHGLAEDATEFIHKADKAVTMKDLTGAEENYTQALALEPDNYRLMKSLAEVKTSLRKFAEADDLIGKILAMPVLVGRQVMVTLAGQEPQEAEIVDETVVPPSSGQNNMRNYLESQASEPVPHYRLFLKKSGQLLLIPKSEAKVKFLGVSERDRDLVQELQIKVKNELMAASKSDVPPDEMVDIKGGCFKMGSSKGDVDELPVHEVCVSDFKMDKYEVTQKAFFARMGSNPARNIGPDLAVDSATWFEAVEYCAKQNKRLPTEAEWEYAARGGTQTEFYTGDTITGKQANFCDKNCTLNIRDDKQDDGNAVNTRPGQYPPNPFGLYDMAGNLSEWVSDWLLENYYQVSPKQDPKGPEEGANRVVRGGGWDTKIDMLRSASRLDSWPDFRIEGFGIRCAANK